MIREVVQIGNPVLRETCKTITRFDYELAALLDDLKDTVKREQGAGLAAPQIGVPVRVAVVDVFVWQKGEQVGPEGCLSVRGKVGTVRRPDKVKIIFQDRKGDKYSLVARGFFARAICHEFDHLDGVVYTDKATNIKDAEE